MCQHPLPKPRFIHPEIIFPVCKHPLPEIHHRLEVFVFPGSNRYNAHIFDPPIVLTAWEKSYGFNLNQIIGVSEAADEQQRVRGERVPEEAVADTTKSIQVTAFGQIRGQLDDIFQTPSKFLENGLKIRVDLVSLCLDIAFPYQVAARVQGDLTGDVDGVAGLCYVRVSHPRSRVDTCRMYDLTGHRSRPPVLLVVFSFVGYGLPSQAFR